MLIGIGSTLIAFGAFLAFVVALTPVPGVDRVGHPEHYRRQRISTLTSVFAGASALAGAVLLIASAWPWALVAIGAAAVLYFALMIVATHLDNRDTLRMIRTARDVDKDEEGRPGRIWLVSAAWMGFAPDDVLDAEDAPAFWGEPRETGAMNLANGVQRIAEERARLSWAIQHPFGGGQTPRSMLRFLILRLRYKLELHH